MNDEETNAPNFKYVNTCRDCKHSMLSWFNFRCQKYDNAPLDERTVCDDYE